METTRSSEKKRKSEPKTTLHDLTDDVLANILRRVEVRKNVSQICRKWYEVDRAVTRKLKVGGARLVPAEKALTALSSRYLNLTELVISHDRSPGWSVQFNDECLRCISVGFLNLTDLTMVACDHVTDVGIASLALCPKLTGVRLSLVRGVSGAGLLSLLSGCRTLRLLHLKEMNYVWDLEWLHFIGTHALIESLAIKLCTQIGEYELCRLGRRGWRNLREFIFERWWWMSPWDAPRQEYGERFRAWKSEDPEGNEYFPNLEVLSLRNCISMPGPGMLWILSQCKALRRVEICYCDGVQDDEVCQFTRNNPQLSSISWMSSSRLHLTSQILASIGENCRNLLSLSVLSTVEDGSFGPGFFDPGMGALVEGCTRLRALSVHGVRCFGERTAAAIGHSTSLKDLKIFYLHGFKVTPHWCKRDHVAVDGLPSSNGHIPEHMFKRGQVEFELLSSSDGQIPEQIRIFSSCLSASRSRLLSRHYKRGCVERK